MGLVATLTPVKYSNDGKSITAQTDDTDECHPNEVWVEAKVYNEKTGLQCT